jgi:hypothetical protein
VRRVAVAREQVGTAPVREDDTATVGWVQEQLAAGLATVGVVATRIIGEIPTGNRDGANQRFTTQYDFAPGTTDVFVNGLREALGLTYDEEAPNTVVLASPPLPEDDIRINYFRQTS